MLHLKEYGLFRASSADQDRLLSVPESGMGYQVIYARDELYLVINATVVIPFGQLLEERFSEEDYEVLSGDPDGERISSLRTRDTNLGFELAYSDFESELRTRQVGLNFNRNAIEPSPRIFAPHLFVLSICCVL
jgi:hypothetical protein